MWLGRRKDNSNGLWLDADAMLSKDLKVTILGMESQVVEHLPSRLMVLSSNRSHTHTHTHTHVQRIKGNYDDTESK
jgi:hypothetical protein